MRGSVRVVRHLRWTPLHRAAGWTLPVASAALVVALWTQVRAGGIPDVDRWARSQLAELQDPSVFTVLNVVKDVGSLAYAVPLLLSAAAVLSVVGRDVRPLLTGGVAVAVLAGTTLLLKAAVARPGPSGVGPPAVDGAWPSGHAVTVVVTVLVLLRLVAGSGGVPRVLLGPAVLVPAIVGFALVYCGHHWLSDVVVAAPLGYLIFRAATATVGAIPVTLMESSLPERVVGSKPALDPATPSRAQPSRAQPW